MNLNLPNILTLSRLGFIPVIMVCFFLPYEWARPAAAWLYGLASLTDWFDGYLARKLDQQTKLGAFLDPVADKMLVAVALILIASENAEYHGLVIVGTCVIISREIAISALREWMATLGKGATVSVSMTGKVKTAVQMLTIGFLLHKQPFLGVDTRLVGVMLLIIATGLTIASLLIYLKASWKDMREHA